MDQHCLDQHRIESGVVILYETSSILLYTCKYSY